MTQPETPRSMTPSPQRVGKTSGAEEVRAAIPADDTQPSWAWRHRLITALLDMQQAENADRPDFAPGIDREMVENAINGLLGIYDCRSSDFAAAYAWSGFWRTMRVDWEKLVFLPADPTPSITPESKNDQ